MHRDGDRGDGDGMAETLEYASAGRDVARRVRRTVICGILIAIGGLVIRLAARALSPRSGSWAPGDWEQTEQAFWQGAWADVGSASLLGGMIIIGLGLSAWCRESRGA